MKCPKCGHKFNNPISQAGGKVKGLLRGFAVSGEAQKRAQESRRRARLIKAKMEDDKI